MSLPTDDKARKALPIFRGPLMYFPDALLALAAVCKAGNDQHNPGQPLHWAREKSTEQMDTALRHMMDHGTGTLRDTDGTWHLAKAAWRILAELQLSIEEGRGDIVRGSDGVPQPRNLAKVEAALDEMIAQTAVPEPVADNHRIERVSRVTKAYKAAESVTPDCNYCRSLGRQCSLCRLKLEEQP